MSCVTVHVLTGVLSMGTWKREKNQTQGATGGGARGAKGVGKKIVAGVQVFGHGRGTGGENRRKRCMAKNLVGEEPGASEEGGTLVTWAVLFFRGYLVK